MAHVLADLRILPKQQCDEAAALAKELGLELQARRYEKPLAEEAFTALSADEMTLWAHHCPTRYVPGGGSGVRTLEQYAFDSVPIEVMRHWKAIKDHYTFDRFEVWTTECTPQPVDPLLIGVIGQKLYLLARWGLESPEHLPLRELAEKIYAAGIKEAEEWCADYPFQSRERKIASNLRMVRNWQPQYAAAERYLGRLP